MQGRPRPSDSKALMTVKADATRAMAALTERLRTLVSETTGNSDSQPLTCKGATKAITSRWVIDLNEDAEPKFWQPSNVLPLSRTGNLHTPVAQRLVLAGGVRVAIVARLRQRHCLTDQRFVVRRWKRELPNLAVRVRALVRNESTCRTRTRPPRRFYTPAHGDRHASATGNQHVCCDE